MFRKAMFSSRIIKNTRKISLKHNLSEDNVGRTLRNSLEEYSDIQFEPLRVQNYFVGTSFSKSGVTIQSCNKEFDILRNNTEDRYINSCNVSSQMLDFRTLFINGFRALEQNIEGVLTQNENINFALQAFRTEFLHNKGESTNVFFV